MLYELATIAAGENVQQELANFIEERMQKLYSELQPPAPRKGETLRASAVVVQALTQLDAVRATLKGSN